jgi:hypothetical protein
MVAKPGVQRKKPILGAGMENTEVMKRIRCGPITPPLRAF